MGPGLAAVLWKVFPGADFAAYYLLKNFNILSKHCVQFLSITGRYGRRAALGFQHRQ
jgi:hypothetical protein